jgi:hypothetical protein
VKPSLFAELERVLDSKNMILVAIHHGQVTVDGYVVKLTDDRRWTRRQLAGRMAKLNYREARLFGMSQRCPTPTTSAVTT